MTPHLISSKSAGETLAVYVLPAAERGQQFADAISAL